MTGKARRGRGRKEGGVWWSEGRGEETRASHVFELVKKSISARLHICSPTSGVIIVNNSY